MVRLQLLLALFGRKRSNSRCRLIGVKRTSQHRAPKSENDPKPTSLLWHPGQTHPLVQALAPGKISRIIAQRVGAEAADSEAWIEYKSSLHGGPRFVHVAEPRESGGEKKI